MPVAPPDDLLADLNPAQREAVLHVEGPLLVIAGAGSGKTRVLTRRVAHLIRAHGVKPNEILAITFTNKAAGEMRERLERMLGRQARAAWILTFHAACGRMLRREAERLGYRSTFTIYDQADQVRVVKACLEDLGVDPKRFTPRGIHSQISNAKNQLIGPDEYMSRVASFYDQTVAEVYERYQKRLISSNAVDFDDMLMLTVEALERFPDALAHWQHTFRYVLVDEYQDTNHAQYRLLQLLAGEHGNVFAVGDPDQSVYGFRGADIRNILDFEADFPGAQSIALEQNYRSTNAILRAANAVIENNRDRKPKRLFSELGEGEPVQVVEVEDEHTEARFVAAEIARLVEEGWSAAELAVFYRTNAQSRVLEDVLVRQQIPYQVIGGPRFYERAEIKDVVAYLSVLDNPSDAVSLLRIANRPRRGIGDTSLQRLVTHADALGVTLFEAMADPEAAGLGTAAIKAVRGFHTLMQSLQASAQELEVDELVEAVLARSGTIEALEAERTIEARGRIENLEELVGVAREFKAEREEPTLVGVPAGDIARLRPGRSGRGRRARDADDDPQREGARVPRCVPDRDGGRHLPALTLDRGQRDRGGAPARVRRHDACDGEVDPDPRNGAFALRPSRVQPPVALHRRAPGRGRAREAAAVVVDGVRLGTAVTTAGPRGNRDSLAADGRLGPARLARRRRGDQDRVGWARHRPVREGRKRAKADARVRAAREDRLMAIQIRTTRSPAEFESAIGALFHYFGGPRASDDAERFGLTLPFERMHAAFDGDTIVGGAGAFPLELTVPGAQLPCAGVTVVGVLPTHRRRGILARMMRAQLADIRERGVPVAALWASEETIYGRFGYGLATQDALIRASRVHAALRSELPGPTGTTRLVSHDEALRAFPPIFDRVRRRTPGFVSRTTAWWEGRQLDDRPERRFGAGELNRVLLEIDGRPAGYALYRIKFEFDGGTSKSVVQVREAIGDSPAATREIWRFLLGIDLTDEIEGRQLPPDHPLFLLVQRPDRLGWKVGTGLWLRLVDVGAALSARDVAADGRVVFDVAADPVLPDNVGIWSVEGDVARRSRRRPDVRLDVQALASAYLGGFTFAELARAGRVEEVARGGIARADALFRVDAKPWCPEIF